MPTSTLYNTLRADLLDVRLKTWPTSRKRTSFESTKV